MPNRFAPPQFAVAHAAPPAPTPTRGHQTEPRTVAPSPASLAIACAVVACLGLLAVWPSAVQRHVRASAQPAAVVAHPAPAAPVAVDPSTTSFPRAFAMVDPGVASLAAKRAITRVGTPYLWGGTTRRGLDCSALVQWAYEQQGLHLPRTTWQQYAAGVKVARSNLRRGDIVFFYDLQHEGMYLGHGRWVQASSRHAHVIVERMPRAGYYGAVRPVFAASE